MRPRRVLVQARRRFRHAIHWLWSQEGSAGQRARGLAVGVFCGCYPFFGLQIVISVAAASMVRGNHLLAAAGTLVSNPVTYVPLYWFNYLVGDHLLPASAGSTDLRALHRSSLWDQGWEFTTRLLLGSTLVGAVLALVSGLIAYRLFRRRSRAQTEAALN